MEDTRAWLGVGAEELPIIFGDARDRRFLDTMVDKIKMVLAAVGPYAGLGASNTEFDGSAPAAVADRSNELMTQDTNA